MKLFVRVLPIANWNYFNDQSAIKNDVNDAIFAYADAVGIFGVGELTDASGPRLRGQAFHGEDDL